MDASVVYARYTNSSKEYECFKLLYGLHPLTEEVV
jgi:hypothetical protein